MLLPPIFMPRNQIKKQEIRARILKLKHQIFEESCLDCEKELAHKYLNAVLNIIEEYRY